MQIARPDYDATFCGKLPLHQTNLIQPHGVLFVLEKKGQHILQVSENCTELLAQTAQEVNGQLFARLLSEQSRQQFMALLSATITGKLPITLSFAHKAGELLALVHEQAEMIFVEVEVPRFFSEKGKSFLQVFQQLKKVIAEVEAAETVQDVVRLVAAEVKWLSGFDKVMVYSFDEDWNGTVVAEEMEEGMDSYMGLKFPASDVPKPARDLYLKNPYRLIPDRTYTPVRLYPLLNPLTHAFSNLTDCDLRSVATVHLEYLKNMEVTASMSTRIVHNGKLWGLIACHHRTAKYLSFEQCSVFELLSNVISAKISLLLNQQAFTEREELSGLLNQMIEQLYRHDYLHSALHENKQLLLRLLRANGVALCMNGRIEAIGETPHHTEIESVCFFLHGTMFSGVYHQPSLPKEFDEATHFSDKASGILALPIQADKSHYIMAFRPEAVREVSWGGNPNEAVQFDPGTTVYHPRHSFDVWRETVRQTAIPWKPEEIAVAEAFRNSVVEYTLNRINK